MNVLIISEKPSLSRAIAPTARTHWPEADIRFVHAVPYGNIKFRYPRGIPLRDYPALSAPRDSISDWDQWKCAPLALGADGTLTELSMGHELFTGADLIVCACDPDHTGAIAFSVIMAVVFGDDRALQCPALRMFALDRFSVERAFAEMQPFGVAFRQSLKYGLVKRYFDWNWNVNALAVLGGAARRAGVPADAPPLSKYSLQLLYALRGRAPMRDGKIAELMQRWPGTGRYKYGPGEWRPTVGSAASVVQIIENLVGADLLASTLPQSPRLLGDPDACPFALSATGQRLLELLHPDCEDPDLPFRLDAWCNEGDSARPAIDRYIRTFFGKQMRFKAPASPEIIEG